MSRARVLIMAVALLSLAIVLGACSENQPAPRQSASPASSSNPQESAAPALSLVAVGDSEATGHGDPTGEGWVGRYAKLLDTEMGRKVTVTSLAEDGLTSDLLVEQLTSDANTMAAIAAADIIVIGAGGADLNAGDDRFAAGTCSAEACYKDDLAAFAQNMDEAAVAIAKARDGKPTLFRAITPPNVLTGAESVIPPFLRPVATRVGVYQAKSIRSSVCSAMHKHHGDCIDVLTAFNGASGKNNAYKSGLMNLSDCCYPSAKGQQLMAELLIKTGTMPVVLA
jgi:lysophospholipase L1-like esterase